MMLKWPIRAVAALVLSLSPASLLLAQSTNSGDINGIVTDSTGAMVPGATVTVTNIDTGVSRDINTNASGVYDTSSIVAGNYKLTFAKPGFEQFVRTSVTIPVGQTTINATLTVGSVNESVVVTTDVPLLRTESGEQSTTLTAQTLNELPQVGQDWSSFDILLPGAAGTPAGAQGVAGTGTSNGTMLAVNGNLPFSTVLADGAETTLPASANSDINIQETLQEVQISTSAFSAQYGVGGILYNQISKGGTNGFHGSAYEYFQNDALNADNYAFQGQTPTRAPLRYDNFGGSVGGPILKDKLFFFFDYDRVIQHGGASTGSYDIPTQAVLNGDFTGFTSKIYDPATRTPVQPNTPNNQYTYADGTVATCPCYIRTAFPGNIIPANRIDPVAKAISTYFPTPNAAGKSQSNGFTTGNYTFTSRSSNPFTRYFGRIDYNVNAKNRITISETEGDNPGQSFGAGICPIGCQSGDVSRNNAQITEVWTASPRLSNEARFGYTNQLNFFVPLTLGLGYPAKIGFKFAKADNFPSINIGGYSGVLNSASNAVYKEHAYDPSDVVTFVAGKHILHFGGEFLMYQNNSTAWGNLDAGTLGYSGAYTQLHPGDAGTGLGYADFLLGQTTSWGARETPEYGGRMKLPQLFIQDDFKVLSNLTLNLGLRYQIQTGWREVKGNAASFDPAVANTIPATATAPKTTVPGGIWYGVTHANGRTTLQAPVYNTFLPRVGFSYQLDTNTILRGGFGLYAYNWSNDTYNGNAMGGAFGSKGGVSDTSGGLDPVVILSSTGENLKYVASSTDPTAYNGSDQNYVAYHQPVGGSYQWNIQGQRQFGPNLVASLAYVASHGHDLPFPVDINQVPQNKLSQNDQQSRPYPLFGHLYTSGTVPGENAISNYNSLQAVIEKRFTQGLSFNFNYTWSHFMDDLDSAGWGSHAGSTAYQNAYNPSANYGNSNFDIRNAFKGNVIYLLPFGKGARFMNNSKLLDEAIGGWKLSSTIVIQSGQPFTVFVGGADLANSQASSGYALYPNVVGNPKLANRSVNQWFNEAAFAIPAPYTFGNERRNQLTGPPFSRVNLSLGKIFTVTERVHVQVRGDANNAFNHPSFALPNQYLSTNGTGNGVTTGTSTITGVTSPARTMQVSARLTF